MLSSPIPSPPLTDPSSSSAITSSEKSKMILRGLSLGLLILSSCTLLVASQEAAPATSPPEISTTVGPAEVSSTIVTSADPTTTEATIASGGGATETATSRSDPPAGTTPSDQDEPEAVTKVLEDTLSEPRETAAKEVTTTESNDSNQPTGAPTAEDTTQDDSSLLLGKSISHAHSEDGAENSVHKEESEHGETGSENNDEPNLKLSIETDQPKRVASSFINMTQIDQIYVHGTKDEQVSADNWRRLGKKLKKSVSHLLGSMVPFALNMTAEAKIGSNCSGAMLKWVLSMNQLKAWALRMLDASGKPIAGLLEGSMTMFGNYRQCLKVRAPDDDEIEFAGEFREYFRGKYCIIQAKPWLPQKDRFYNLNTKLKTLMEDSDNEWYDRTIFEELNEWLLAFNFVNIRYDLCVPSTCSREDIQKVVNYLLGDIELKARVLRCETDGPGNGLMQTSSIESGSPELAEALMATGGVPQAQAVAQQQGGYLSSVSSQLGWIFIPVFAIIVVLIATALSLTIKSDPDTDMDSVTNGNPVKRRSKLKHTIRSLSLKRSLGSHLNVDYNQLADDKPLALYGLRFLLVLWVILVESAVNIKFEYLRELMMLKDLIFWWPLQFIINSTMQYDSFILLTAFTMGYKNCLNDGLNNVKAITMYVVDKYIRLMPSIMMVVALVILMPLTYRGPVWNDYVTKQSAVCQSTGWLNTIFLQNYLPYNQICLPQTWLLCVEFQLLLIMAPIVYYLNKSYSSKFGNGSPTGQISLAPARGVDSTRAFHWLWTKPGMILTGCIVFGLGSSFYNVYFRELPPSWFYTMADPDSKALYFGEHMTKIWTHLAVFAMGILAGVECRRATKNVYRSYTGSNINLISHADSSLSKKNKGHASSASSLPIMLARNGGPNAEIESSHTSASEWNNSNTGSSISINILNNINSSKSFDDKSKSSFSVGYVHYESDHEAHGGFCSTLIDFICLLLAITIMSAIIFSTHDWSVNDLPKPMVAGMFDAGSRFLWSLAMIWILYMISVPNRDRSFSCVAKMLGHPGMVFLGKLSFLIYIIHPFVHTLVLAIQEQPIYSSWLMLFHILIGNITITVILASFVSVFVEMPCRNLFRRCGTSLLLTQSVPTNHKIPTEA